MVLKVGITGGMGSGKSVVCKIFKLIDIPVFEADREAKKLLDSHPEIKKDLTNLFGKAIYIPDMGIDRKKLASIIFNDNIALEKVNNIIHPRVREVFNSWVSKQDAPYILHEAAILFESGFYKMMDLNILVSADRELKIKRVMERDGVARDDVVARLKNQWDDDKKAKLADLMIQNNHELLIPQVLETDKKIRRKWENLVNG